MAALSTLAYLVEIYWVMVMSQFAIVPYVWKNQKKSAHDCQCTGKSALLDNHDCLMWSHFLIGHHKDLVVH